MSYLETVIFQQEAPFRTPVELRRFRFGAPGDGIHIAIVSGMNGNETGGVLAVNHLIQWLQGLAIVGCIDVYPVINPVGVDQSSKLNPLDHRDINRCFPGNDQGTISERIAAAIFEATADCDRVVSVHTGAAHVCDVTQVRCLQEDRELFQQVGAALLWIKDQLDGQVGLLGQCQLRGQSVVYCTSGSGNSVDHSLVVAQTTVLKSILSALGMVDFVSLTNIKTAIFEGRMMEYRSTAGGFFSSQVSVGDTVDSGASLGVVHYMYGGRILEQVTADYRGLVVSVRVNPVVHHHELLIKLVPLP